MKKYLLVGVIIVGIALFALYQYQKYRVAPKADLNSMTFTDTSGKVINLSVYKGRKIIFTFFATWCGDCLLEMKQLNETMQTKLKDVRVIVVSDEPMEKIKRFAMHKNYPFTYWQLPNPFAEINIYAIPVTYIINNESKITYSKVGAINWKDPSIVSYTEENLKQ